MWRLSVELKDGRDFSENAESGPQVELQAVC